MNNILFRHKFLSDNCWLTHSRLMRIWRYASDRIAEYESKFHRIDATPEIAANPSLPTTRQYVIASFSTSPSKRAWLTSRRTVLHDIHLSARKTKVMVTPPPSVYSTIPHLRRFNIRSDGSSSTDSSLSNRWESGSDHLDSHYHRTHSSHRPSLSLLQGLYQAEVLS